MTLSKSDYMLFLRHPAWVWLKRHEKGALPPVDDNTLAMFEVGHLFETHAEEFFPGGVRLGFGDYQEYLALPKKTAEALAAGAGTIFQGRFEVDGLTCVVDILSRVEGTTFDLIEVKSSTKAKPEHYYDLAFQTYVLEKAGLTIREVSVMHADSNYVRDGEIDPTRLVATTEVTEKVRELVELTKIQIAQALAVLDLKERPDISPRFVNQVGVAGVSWFGEWMEIFATLTPSSDPYSIYALSYPTAQQIGKLEDAGIEQIADIPEEMALRSKQVAQIQTTRGNTRILEKEKIAGFIDSLVYPLYFFDYETMSSVIPQFDGLSPYKDYPFQYSLHVLDALGAELRHVEYLHAEKRNPMPGLLAQLQKDIGGTGTVLTWNMSYEKGCNTRMAELYPEHAAFLDGLNERIDDLMLPFSKMWFVDKDFFGSASVKRVMPVLAPELSYKDLGVGDGLLARRLWTETVLDEAHEAERNQIMADLSAYCTMDTYAMVRILEELRKLVNTL